MKYAIQMKESNSEIVDSSLSVVLGDIIPGLCNDKNNAHVRVFKSLRQHGMTNFEHFIDAGLDEIQGLGFVENGREKPLSPRLKGYLSTLKGLILQYRVEGRVGAMCPRTYTRELVQQYDLAKQQHAGSTIQTVQREMGGSIDRKYTPVVKTVYQERLDTWNRGKRSKTDFPILTQDKDYMEWKTTFVAELRSQGLSDMIDIQYNPDFPQDSYKTTLYNKQSAFFWTVLLRSLKNPLGSISVNEHKINDDARGAWFKHENYQKQSKAKIYQASHHLQELIRMSIANYSGSRVEFLSEWFSKLHETNKIQGEMTNFITARTLLMNALSADTDLTRDFSDLPGSDTHSTTLST